MGSHSTHHFYSSEVFLFCFVCQLTAMLPLTGDSLNYLQGPELFRLLGRECSHALQSLWNACAFWMPSLPKCLRQLLRRVRWPTPWLHYSKFAQRFPVWLMKKVYIVKLGKEKIMKLQWIKEKLLWLPFIVRQQLWHISKSSFAFSEMTFLKSIYVFWRHYK